MGQANTAFLGVSTTIEILLEEVQCGVWDQGTRTLWLSQEQILKANTGQLDYSQMLIKENRMPVPPSELTLNPPSEFEDILAKLHVDFPDLKD